MDQLADVLGILSGLRFVAPYLDPTTTVVTAVAMHVTYAVLCWIFATKNRRSGVAWSAAGFLGGAAIALALLVANERQESREQPPAT
ncbi:MAG TPA: hypothetical protein VIS07_01700 [Candidatus Binatia bacterium]